MIKIYCDGACSGNPGKGGWAFVIPFLNVERSGFNGDTTNNRMEITAVINALKYIDYMDVGEEVEIITDSQYVINTMIKGWAKNKNIDLWEELEFFVHRKTIKWTWVKGHNADKFNERADELAVKAYKETVGDSISITFKPYKECGNYIIFRFNDIFVVEKGRKDIVFAGNNEEECMDYLQNHSRELD